MQFYKKEIICPNKEKYQILQILGTGYFSTVFKCINLKDNRQYAIKIQFKSTKGHDLKREIQIINDVNSRLKKVQYQMLSIIKIPEIFAYHIRQEKEQNQIGNFVIMSLCEKSLQEKMVENQSLFTQQMVLLIGYLLICIIEGIHKTGYLHRDIKPQNILIQKVRNSYKQKTINNQETSHDSNEVSLVLVDFGLSLRYLDENNKHFQFIGNKTLTGSLAFSSLNSHKGYRFSRRDEIQNILFTLIYMKNGNLPWSYEHIKQEIQKKNIKKQEITQKMKNSIQIELLCKGFSQQFIQIFRYVRKLKFQQEPNYNYIKQNIKKSLVKMNLFQQQQMKDIDINKDIDIDENKGKEQKKKKKNTFQSYLKQKISLLAE